MRAFIGLCILSLATAGLRAQQDMGVITGVVLDATGAAVPGAVVTAIHRDTNERRSAETGPTGAYTVGPLRVGTYELPFGAERRWLSRGGVLNLLLGSWQMSSLVSAQTGHYFSLTVPNARTRLGATGVGDWRPDRVADGRLSRRTADRWFDTAAFVLPRDPDGSFHFGNAGRSILSSDGPFNIDPGLMKTFALTERLRLQFRWEVFNLTNTPTLADPVVNVESPDFGKVRATDSVPRQMQFALRLVF